MTAQPIYRAPVAWPTEPEPTTVRRWPVRVPIEVERGYHDATRGGRTYVPAAEILAREANR